MHTPHLKKSSEKYLVALEELNFLWTVKEVRDFRYLWREGAPLTDIAAYLKRTHEEVAILIMDQALKDFVEPREGGIF